MAKKRGGVAHQEPFQLPKKGSPQRVAMQQQRVAQQKELKKQSEDDRVTPPWATGVFVALGVPQSVALYSMIWNDLLSDNFFYTFDLTFNWIALLVTMEGAAG
jgi:hypothetical protein